MRRLSKREREKREKKGEGGEGRVPKRFRSHMILKHTLAVRSIIWSKLIFARLCVML